VSHLDAATGSAVCNRTVAASTSAVRGFGAVAPALAAVATARAVSAGERAQGQIRSEDTTQF
jgi:hypothetical protein